jgi:hypothetical protein
VALSQTSDGLCIRPAVRSPRVFYAVPVKHSHSVVAMIYGGLQSMNSGVVAWGG